MMRYTSPEIVKRMKLFWKLSQQHFFPSPPAVNDERGLAREVPRRAARVNPQQSQVDS